MKTILAKHAGFCFGVKNAVKKVQGKNYPKPVYTLGPIAHNTQLTDRLSNRGIKIINAVKVKKGTIIIRAHGVSQEIIQKAKGKKLNVIDATCPFVKKAQNKAIELEKENYHVVILGESNHPEVIGIIGNLKNPTIIENLNQAKKLIHYTKIGFVSQTTQELDLFERVKDVLNKKTHNFKFFNTICLATKERQESAKNLAKKVDLMIVVGGKDSGNTRRLTQICSKIIKTHQIETSNKLNKKWFISKKICGITAGASTPEWIIKDAVNKIGKL